MNEIGTFDILGPNMIGPSSSHTAGALRIAFIAGKMVGRVKSARFVLYGSFARTYHGHGTDRALVGGILGYHPDDERIRDSFHYAEEAGIEISFEENFTDKEVFPNTVDIYLTGEDGDSMSLRGESIGGGNAVITRLNGVEVELTGNYCTMVVQHVDKKGTLAFVTTVLSAYDLNIGSLRLYRESRGKIAYAIIELDATVPEQVVHALKGIEDYDALAYIFENAEVTPNYVGEKNYPDYYGGIFLDQNQFLIVLVKGNGEFYRPELERRAGGSNFIIRPYDYSMNELLEVYDELNRYLTAHQAFCTDTLHYYGHGIRTDLNRISVHLGDCSPASISKFKATIMDDDRLIFEKGEIAVFD